MGASRHPGRAFRRRQPAGAGKWRRAAARLRARLPGNAAPRRRTSTRRSASIARTSAPPACRSCAWRPTWRRERVRETGMPYAFAPMSSRERRILHLAMRDMEDLRTESAGEAAAAPRRGLSQGLQRARRLRRPLLRAGDKAHSPRRTRSARRIEKADPSETDSSTLQHSRPPLFLASWVVNCRMAGNELIS